MLTRESSAFMGRAKNERRPFGTSFKIMLGAGVIISLEDLLNLWHLIVGGRISIAAADAKLQHISDDISVFWIRNFDPGFPGSLTELSLNFDANGQLSDVTLTAPLCLHYGCCQKGAVCEAVPKSIIQGVYIWISVLGSKDELIT